MDKRPIKWWMKVADGKKVQVQVSLYDSTKPMVLSLEEFQARYESNAAGIGIHGSDDIPAQHSMYLRDK